MRVRVRVRVRVRAAPSSPHAPPRAPPSPSPSPPWQPPPPPPPCAAPPRSPAKRRHSPPAGRRSAQAVCTPPRMQSAGPPRRRTPGDLSRGGRRLTMRLRTSPLTARKVVMPSSVLTNSRCAAQWSLTRLAGTTRCPGREPPRAGAPTRNLRANPPTCYLRPRPRHQRRRGTSAA